MKTLFPLLFIFIAAAFAAPARAGDDGLVAFEGKAGAIVRQVQPGGKSGDALLETGYSDPAGVYDTVMLNGEMPGELALRICVKDGASAEGCARYSPSKIKIYGNGRFWAKFSLGQTTSQPFKFTVTDEGKAGAGTFIVYAVEAFRDTKLESSGTGPETELQAPAPYSFPLVTRAQWHAKPPKEAYTAQKPVMFTLHHTAGKFTRTLEESKEEVLFDQDYHQNKNGWNDIGYHFLIDPLGNIFEGRPVTAVGAHVEGWNTNNVGISIMGYYHPPVSDQPTAAELEAFVKIGRYLRDNYGVKPEAFYAHRELNETACPGDLLYPKKQELKDLIFQTPLAGPPAESRLKITAALDELGAWR